MSDDKAFPESYGDPRNQGWIGGGMTLRDYFAAHAPETPDMQTFPIKQWKENEIVDLGNGMKGPRSVLHQESWAERAARWAIEYADAMLAQRANPGAPKASREGA